MSTLAPPDSCGTDAALLGHRPGESAPAARRVDVDIAIVHDYLNQRGGAERVVSQISDLWPQAPIYTSLYRPESTFSSFMGREVRTSPLDRLPVDRGFRNLFPLYPGAFRALGPIDADVVITSTSGWAHMVRTRPDALHIVYCHNPARWLYSDAHLSRSLGGTVARATFGAMRRLDKHAAGRADIYLANSHNVRRRIQEIYARDALVLAPPVDIDRFRPTPRGERLLVVSRLLPYKRIDLVIAAANAAGVGLDIVGTGPMLGHLLAMSGPNVKFHGATCDHDLVDLMQNCRAVCVPGEEDFGMVSVEAQAAGKPVIAFGYGGSLETVREGLTGSFFFEHTRADFLRALRRADQITTAPEQIAENAQGFSADTFRRSLLALVESACRARDLGVEVQHPRRQGVGGEAPGHRRAAVAQG